jgi:hypothetical protein
MNSMTKFHLVATKNQLASPKPSTHSPNWILSTTFGMLNTTGFHSHQIMILTGGSLDLNLRLRQSQHQNRERAFKTPASMAPILHPSGSPTLKKPSLLPQRVRLPISSDHTQSEREGLLMRCQTLPSNPLLLIAGVGEGPGSSPLRLLQTYYRSRDAMIHHLGHIPETRTSLSAGPPC